MNIPEDKNASELEKELVSLLKNTQPKVLFVTHNRGGGVEKHLQELKKTLPDSIDSLILRPSSDGSRCVVVEYAEHLKLFFDFNSDIEILNEFLLGINLTQIHIHHTKGFNQTILDLITQLGLPWDFTIHDYYSICPQITLIDKKGLYCQEKGLDSCMDCLRERPAPGGLSIVDWRKKYQSLITGAKRCFVPSVDVFNRMEKYYPDANYITTYHEKDLQEEVHLINNSTMQVRRLRVLVIGALTPMKGAGLLEKAAIDAKKRNLPIDFILIGEGYRKLVCKPSSNLEIMGKYIDEDLQKLIADCHPDLVWFTALWPETYSYTLSAAINAKLPVVAPDIGAFQERLFNRELSWIVPWDFKASVFNDFFMLLRDRMYQLKNEKFDNNYRSITPPAVEWFSYQDNYIEDNKVVGFKNKQNVEKLFSKLKTRFESPANLFSIIKYSLLNLLNKLRKMSIFSWFVKRIPQSFQTRLKGWMLGESE